MCNGPPKWRKKMAKHQERTFKKEKESEIEEEVERVGVWMHRGGGAGRGWQGRKWAKRKKRKQQMCAQKNLKKLQK